MLGNEHLVEEDEEGWDCGFEEKPYRVDPD